MAVESIFIRHPVSAAGVLVWDESVKAAQPLADGAHWRGVIKPAIENARCWRRGLRRFRRRHVRRGNGPVEPKIR